MSEEESVKTTEEDNSPSISERMLNLKGMYNSKCYLFTTLIFTVLLFAVSVIQTIASVQNDNLSMVKMANQNIMKLLLIVILVFAGIDVLIKMCECINWFRRRNLRQRIFKKIISEQTLAQAEDEADFYHNYFHGEDIRYDLNKTIIVTDILLTIVMFILLIIEIGNESINEKALPIIIITRGYLKLPFAYCLLIHYFRIKDV